MANLPLKTGSTIVLSSDAKRKMSSANASTCRDRGRFAIGHGNRAPHAAFAMLLLPRRSISVGPLRRGFHNRDAGRRCQLQRRGHHAWL